MYLDQCTLWIPMLGELSVLYFGLLLCFIHNNACLRQIEQFVLVLVSNILKSKHITTMIERIQSQIAS